MIINRNKMLNSKIVCGRNFWKRKPLSVGRLIEERLLHVLKPIIYLVRLELERARLIGAEQKFLFVIQSQNSKGICCEHDQPMLDNSNSSTVDGALT